MREHSLCVCVELDTIIGRPGGKTIMTVHFTATGFMFGLMPENKPSAEVSSKTQTLKNKFADSGFRFGDIFPVIRTDSGGEFATGFLYSEALVSLLDIHEVAAEKVIQTTKLQKQPNLRERWSEHSCKITLTLR